MRVQTYVRGEGAEGWTRGTSKGRDRRKIGQKRKPEGEGREQVGKRKTQGHKGWAGTEAEESGDGAERERARKESESESE
eukprot:569151-Pleurochrysis_carterae.AAC.1